MLTSKTRYGFIAFLLGIPSLLLGRDFHDFDLYQRKFKAEEIEHKINQYLKKDQRVERFYRLTEDALYIGDLEHNQIDYVLYFKVTLDPFFKKPGLLQPLKGAKIAIDPGHLGGGYAKLEERYLFIGANQTKDQQPICFCEGDLTYLTALFLKRFLEKEGACVFITRFQIGKGVMEEDFFEWMAHHSFLQQKNLPLSKIFRHFYNNEDLKLRAEKINAFAPDITLILHYNSHEIGIDGIDGHQLTSSNYNLAFIPGAFSGNELSSSDDRYEFLRLIVTDHIEKSIKLSECITKKWVEHLNVPLIDKKKMTKYIQPFCLFQKEGIYHRNLVLTRRIHSPLCYGETLIQNHVEEVERLSKLDASIEGLSAPQRVEQVALAYFEGIKAYFEGVVV